MDCDDFVVDADDSVKDELQIGSLSYEKMVKNLQKEGFRKGSAAGHDRAFQDGFNMGYKAGFEFGHMLGAHNGVLRVLEISTHGIPQEEDGNKVEPFESPMKGLCLFCSSMDPKKQDTMDMNTEVMVNEKTELPVAHILIKQKKTIENEVHCKLKIKYKELLDKLNIHI